METITGYDDTNEFDSEEFDAEGMDDDMTEEVFTPPTPKEQFLGVYKMILSLHERSGDTYAALIAKVAPVRCGPRRAAPPVPGRGRPAHRLLPAEERRQVVEAAGRGGGPAPSTVI